MELEESFLMLAISTGAFAPGVTIEKVPYRRDRAVHLSEEYRAQISNLLLASVSLRVCNEVNRRILRGYLFQEGMIPTVAASALEAIEIASLGDAVQPFDLIIIDGWSSMLQGMFNF
jgi:CheY-like chemotaxis protein